MRIILLFSIVFGVLFACKESKNSLYLMYSGVCNISIPGEPDKTDTLQLFIGDYMIVGPGLFASDTISLKGPDGTMLTKAKFGNLTVDLSNREAVIGYAILETTKKDTIINLNPKTKKEEISVIENVTMDTVGTCSFIKEK